MPDMTGGRLTVIANAGSAAESWPSLTVITMFAWMPASAAAGVPVNAPVVPLNCAQDGLLAMPKVSVVTASASLATGVKEKLEPTCTRIAGVPEIAGGVFDDATVIENTGSAADAVPSPTLITMFWCAPTCAAPGVPSSRAVAGPV